MKIAITIRQYVNRETIRWCMERYNNYQHCYTSNVIELHSIDSHNGKYNSQVRNSKILDGRQHFTQSVIKNMKE